MNHVTLEPHRHPTIRPWGLWGIDSAKPGWWIPANETAGDPILCFASEEDAQESADAHFGQYGITCVPKLLTGEPTGPTEEALVELVKELQAAFTQLELLLMLPILEHQRGKLNQIHMHLVGMVGLLGHRAGGVMFKAKPDPRPAEPPRPPVQVTPAVDRPCCNCGRAGTPECDCFPPVAEAAAGRPPVADAVVDADGWDGTNSGQGGAGGAS